ncbi:MAG: 16S rRNA (uracil(1498)-N(3))-methyltransferase [Thermodesulfobacteriota bacterium]
MHRFFVDPADISGQEAILRAEEAHHLRRVLRLAPGERVELYDGRGGCFAAAIIRLDREVKLTILDHGIREPDRPRLAIGQGLLKGQKMDMLVQKANELGVAAFLPFTSAHCAAGPPREMKRSRWEKIVRESCKQCGRPIPLEIGEIDDFTALLAGAGGEEEKIILWEKEESTRLADIKPLNDTVSIIALIGPEGGFSPAEVDQARQAGFRPVSLGKRTLRAETATLTAMAILQFLGGNL